MAVIKVFGAIFDQQKRILLVHRCDGDQTWTTPGGQLSPGESPERGLERLILLETGLSIQPMRLIGIYSATFKDHIFIFLEAKALNLEGLTLWKPNDYLSEIGFFFEHRLPEPMYKRTRIRLHDAFSKELGKMRVLENH
ncbi:MAG: NUDIX domain-containing protein [Anaerolineaceae bacterium]|nr:NUDIX domain-containing protein [Anaerolineaceae bacterium]